MPLTPTRKSKTSSISVEVTANRARHDPILVSFPGGLPRSVLVEESDGLPKFTCTALNKTRGIKVTGEDETCTYSASAAGRGHDGRLTKMYVCIYDKKTRKLKVTPTAVKGSIFSLDQAVKEYTPNVEHGTMKVGSSDQSSALERTQMLVESFGSKKKQKVMASRASNTVNINAVVGSGSLMAATIAKQEGISLENRRGMEEGGDVVDPSELALQRSRRNFLPPFNEEADKPAKVYDAHQIIGSGWDRTSRVVDRVIEKAKEDGDLATKLLGKNPKSLAIFMLMESIDINKISGLMKTKVAFYTFLAIKFYKSISGRGEIRGNSLDDCITFCRVPTEVGAHLFDLFMSPMHGDSDGYQISRPKKDSLIVHILILYVIAHGRHMKVPSINQLCKDLSMDTKVATERLRQAGFDVRKSSSGDWSASLSVPLKFPRPKRRRGKN